MDTQHHAEYDGDTQYPNSQEHTADLSVAAQLAHMQTMMQQMMQQMDVMTNMTNATQTALEQLQSEVEQTKNSQQAEAGSAGAKSTKAASTAEAVDDDEDKTEDADANKTRMRPLTLGEYSGTKYDGSPAKYEHWVDTIENKLTTHQASATLYDESYYGRNVYNERIPQGAFINSLIRDGEDMQTIVGAYLIQSLSGSILTEVLRMKRQRKDQPVDKRHTLTAYEIFQRVKQEANPTLSRRSRDQVDRRFTRDTLDRGANRTGVDTYVQEKEEQWNYLNRTAGESGEDRISEHMLVSRILSGMEQHHDVARRALETACRENGRYKRDLFKSAIDDQFPKDYSPQDTVMHLNDSPDDAACTHCNKIHRGQCWNDKSQTCENCGVKGHHKKFCPANKDENDEESESKTQKRKEKKMQERAYIQLGKQREQELIQQQQQQQQQQSSLAPDRMFSLRNIQPAPHPPAQPAPTPPAAAPTQKIQEVKLPSGLTVGVPIN